MDFMPLSLNSSSLTCSICALAAIILQLVAIECQKLHIVDSPIQTKIDISAVKFNTLHCVMRPSPYPISEGGGLFESHKSFPLLFENGLCRSHRLFIVAMATLLFVYTYVSNTVELVCISTTYCLD